MQGAGAIKISIAVRTITTAENVVNCTTTKISFYKRSARRLFTFGTFRCGVHFKNQNKKMNHVSIQNDIS